MGNSGDALRWAGICCGAIQGEPLKMPFPTVCGDVGCPVYGKDGETIIIPDSHPLFGLYEIDRKGRVLWALRNNRNFRADYSLFWDSVLVDSYTAETKEFRIHEVKRGKIVNSLKETKLGPIGLTPENNPDICWDKRDKDKFWVADTSNHVVYQTDFTGTIHWQFGEYGVPGSDDLHLNQPKSITHYSLWENRVMLADSGNHRCLFIQMDNKQITNGIPFPYPRIQMFNGDNTALYNGGDPTGLLLGTFLMGSGFFQQPRFLLPFNTNSIAMHPKEPFVFLIAWDCSVYEVSIRNFPSILVPPVSMVLWNNKVMKDMPVYSPPIVDWFRPKKTIIIKSTQKGRIEIETARWTGRDSSWDGSWEKIDSLDIRQGETNYHCLPYVLGIYRAKFILNNNGVVNSWIYLSS